MTASRTTAAVLKPAPGLHVNLLRYLWSTIKHLRQTIILARKILRDLTIMTILGWWWLIVRAIMPTIALIAIVGFVLGDTPLTELPYGLFVIPGMAILVPLQIGLQRGTRCMLQLRRVTDAIYLPKLNISMAALGMPLLYFSVFFVFSLVALGFYWLSTGEIFVRFETGLLLAPALILLNFILICGIISITSVIMLMARDIRFVQPLMIQVLLVFSPIMYPISKLPETMQWIVLKVNPLAPIIEGLRWSLYGLGSLDSFHLIWATVMCLSLFVFGAWFLMRSEWIWEDVL